jgi:hypothetical protein
VVRKLIGVLAGTVLAFSAIGVAVASTAGASANPPGTVTIQADPAVPPHTAIINTTVAAGVEPQYGVEYCSTSTVLTWTTKKCIELVSASEVYLYASKTAGPTFPGHQNLTGGGYTKSTTGATYGTNAYDASGSFSNTTAYCNTLWKHNSTGSYRNMGSVCT